jgi:hypothetical protein
MLIVDLIVTNTNITTDHNNNTNTAYFIVALGFLNNTWNFFEFFFGVYCSVFFGSLRRCITMSPEAARIEVNEGTSQ